MLDINVSDANPGNGSEDILRAVYSFMSQEALVGIPEDNSVRDKGEITNAQLLYIHTNGSPLNRIPARPVIEPAIEHPMNREMIADELERGLEAALDGKSSLEYLDRAGMQAENAAKNWFTGPNGWAPNAGITINGGWMRNRKSGKPVFVKGKRSNRPLVDTRQMLKSITHVVKRRGIP